VSAYALAIRLFPHAFGVAERRPFQTAALFEPVGYSNALGAFAALGVVLALGFSAEGRARLARALAAAAVVLLATVVYFAFSRGAWLALAAGLAAAFVLAPARARLLRAWLVGPLPFAALGISLASHASTLARVDPPLRDAAVEGALLFLALALLAAAAFAARLAAPALEPHRGRIRSVAALALALAITGTAAGTFASDAPTRPATSLGTERGASVALGRRDEFWHAAWNAFEERPLTGFGAGAFEQYWLEHREHPRNVRDAHNLYVEALAELGAPGLVLLGMLLGLPLVAAVAARARPLVPAALGGLAVYLAHSFVDWDWEVPAMTVTALFVGTALVASADAERGRVGLSARLRAVAVALLLVASAFSVVTFVGNRAGAAAVKALRLGATERAEADARRAARWAPWSAHPLRTLAEAQLLQGERAAATTTIRKALAKEDRDWRLWLTLAIAADGSERRHALERAEALNPLAPRIAELRRILTIQANFERDS
jgi:O-antigen ligase